MVHFFNPTSGSLTVTVEESDNVARKLEELSRQVDKMDAIKPLPAHRDASKTMRECKEKVTIISQESNNKVSERTENQEETRHIGPSS